MPEKQFLGIDSLLKNQMTKMVLPSVPNLKPVLSENCVYKNKATKKKSPSNIDNWIDTMRQSQRSYKSNSERKNFSNADLTDTEWATINPIINIQANNLQTLKPNIVKSHSVQKSLPPYVVDGSPFQKSILMNKQSENRTFSNLIKTYKPLKI